MCWTGRPEFPRERASERSVGREADGRRAPQRAASAGEWGKRPLTWPRRTFGFFLRFFLAAREKAERRGRRAPRIRLPCLHHPWLTLRRQRPSVPKVCRGSRGILGEDSKEATAI
jgi:hypothetical protein